jgi:carbon storage regulator
MLVLSRRVGEVIYINNDITVTLLSAEGNRARIGFNAPENVSIHREEVYVRIKENEKRKPACTSVQDESIVENADAL